MQIDNKQASKKLKIKGKKQKNKWIDLRLEDKEVAEEEWRREIRLNWCKGDNTGGSKFPKCEQFITYTVFLSIFLYIQIGLPVCICFHT